MLYLVNDPMGLKMRFFFDLLVTYYDSIKKLGCNFECKDDIDMVKYPAALGICLDLCSKTVDRDLPIKEIVRMEIERVCGYKVSLDKIEELMSYRYTIL